MGTRFTAKNASQKIPEFGLDKRITNRTNEPFYECPVGKKAKFKGYSKKTFKNKNLKLVLKAEIGHP